MPLCSGFCVVVGSSPTHGNVYCLLSRWIIWSLNMNVFWYHPQACDITLKLEISHSTCEPIEISNKIREVESKNGQATIQLWEREIEICPQNFCLSAISSIAGSVAFSSLISRLLFAKPMPFCWRSMCPIQAFWIGGCHLSKSLSYRYSFQSWSSSYLAFHFTKPTWGRRRVILMFFCPPLFTI